MVNTTNIKTKIYILGISTALILCGCENGGVDLSFDTEKLSSENTVYISEASETVKTTETEDVKEITKVTEAAKTTEPEKTEEITKEPPYIPDDPFEVREYPDDSIVPAEWIPVYSFAEAAKNFDEIVSADVSKMDTANAIIALANKNVIFMNSFWSDYFWTIDYDHPYYSENYKNPNYPDKPIYPLLLSSEYYTDIQEIYDLGSETYTENALNDFYTPGVGISGEEISRKCFIKENGVFYVDLWAMPIWDFAPFKCRTYIEIVSETENKCSFIWYIPDWEMLNEPEEGYEFLYYRCKGEAVYENGSWKLNDVSHDAYMPDWLE